VRRNTLIVGVLSIVLAACGSAPTPAPPSSGQPVALATGSPSPTSSQSPAPTTGPAATPTATATAIATPPPLLPWKKYRSKRNKYTVKYPPDWIVTPGTAKLSDRFDDFGDDSFYVDRDTVSGTASLSLTVTSERAYYKSHYHAKLLQQVNMKVGGWSARMLRFLGSDNGRKIYIQLALVAKGHVGYFITWYSDQGNAKADKALFLRILKTFKPTS
jgi:hypothetical protein